MSFSEGQTMQPPIASFRFLLCVAATTLILLLAPLVGRSSSKCSQMNLLVNVQDLDGRLVKGLTVKNFKMTFHGKSHRIRGAQMMDAKPPFVLLVNTNGGVSKSSDIWDVSRIAI